jgi:RNA polymerase-associated protein CTR9
MLRLGSLAQNAGNLQEASDLFKDALGIDAENADAWIMLGNLDLEKRAHRAARGSFERVLKKIDQRDVYSLIALGNERLVQARNETKADVKSGVYKEATKFFDKVLRMDPRNVYAAAGFGIALAETGHFQEAKDAFIQILEAAPTLETAHLNMAHILVELNQYRNAIPLVRLVLTLAESVISTKRLARSAAIEMHTLH